MSRPRRPRRARWGKWEYWVHAWDDKGREVIIEVSTRPGIRVGEFQYDSTRYRRRPVRATRGAARTGGGKGKP